MTKAGFKKGAQIERWEKALANPEKALKVIGGVIVAESQEAFRESKHGDEAWEDTAPVSVYGIIADFAMGRSAPLQRHIERDKPLIDSGNLSRSVVPKVVSSSAVEVGSNLDYASTHQFGGPIESDTISSDVRTGLWKWLKKQNAELKSQLGWMLNKKFKGEKLEGEVPARPFVAITPQTIEDIREVVGVELMEVD